MIQELHILIGLPGCGKTTWSINFKKEIESKHSWIFSRVHIINCDEKWVMPTKDHRYVVVDGILATQTDVEDCVRRLSKYTIKEIFIHRWEDDVDACLWNDVNRRRKSSATTIQTLKIFDPNSVTFSFPARIISHSVVRKQEYLRLPFTKESEIIDEKYLISDSWTTGGNYSSWDGVGSYVAETPVEFIELDELLINVDVKFPFLIYKKIWRECVTTEEVTESDYYSTVYKQFYKCDLHKLYQILRDTKLI